ncbi:hypothetical protein SAE02_73390 [Skermanella aerolata]|uniref:Uncharacterized protein n=1 Tax=Skermanella aerolata TaxID=393310 RepID=A0A512E381_9PROT|nr:hypothetical protein [Skermanella aerolata]KJB90690.1 hypothetical protein N826_36495 [Skermanella aerolata KACC 11604]GEO43191.1 hypothetical protein SAE02_73390 [Skermanella aerolata]
MKTIKISLLAAGMILGAGSAFAADNNSILGSIDSYSAISQSDMEATKGTYYRKTAKAFADADATARGKKYAFTSTYTDTKACTISCGGGGVSASSVSSSTAIAH